jgi:hypothetical protein
VYRVNNEGLTILDVDGQQRTILGNYFVGLLYMWEAQFDAYEAGVISLDDLQFRNDRYTLNSNYFRENWPFYKENFLDSEFAEYLEENNIGL